MKDELELTMTTGVPRGVEDYQGPPLDEIPNIIRRLKEECFVQNFMVLEEIIREGLSGAANHKRAATQMEMMVRDSCKLGRLDPVEARDVVERLVTGLEGMDVGFVPWLMLRVEGTNLEEPLRQYLNKRG